MILQEKLELFNKGMLLADEALTPDTLLSHEVKLKSKVNNILFERNVSFQSNVLPTNDPVFLGAYSYMNEDGYIRGPVFVGRFCSIGRRVSIGAGMHSFTGISSHPLLSSGSIQSIYTQEEIENLKFKKSKPIEVIIGSDVWIGDGAVILPGVKVGAGSVIGANAVVNNDVAPYSIIGGVPARELRKRFPDKICSDILGVNWWDINLDEIKKLNYKNIYTFLGNNFQGMRPEKYKSFILSAHNKII